MSDINEGGAELETKVDKLIRLLGLLVIKDQKSQKDQILLLHRGGLESKEIADLLSTTRNTVSVAISTAKKESKT